MARRFVVSGLGVGLLAASSWAAVAQQQPPAPNECSGFMCKIFGSPIDNRPQPSPSDPSAPGLRAGKAKLSKAPAKPQLAVVIAADGAEAARLKVLASSIAKPPVHIVPTKTAAAADFTVSPSVDGPKGAERARLFTEQLHIIAGRGVHSPADLKGKVVSFGAEGSASQAAARKAFAALGVSTIETPLDLDNALDGMSTGDVAAVVLLAPQPDQRLSHLATASGLHLVAWPDDVPAPEGTSIASIAGAAYPKLLPVTDHVRAIGIDTSLVASSRAAAKPAAKSFLAALSRQSAALSKRGFDLLGTDLSNRGGRRVASVERR